ncbi:MAG: GFA family protein [Deltaproteobacteria bacterium]|nr:GFA family protein [Deltaproteobacteria bacterium]
MSVSKHDGGCHCGAVRYSVEIDPMAESIACNCSICGRTGAYLQFVTPDKFALHQGNDSLTDYQFNKHIIHHLFCKTCGIRSFARGRGRDGTEMIAINVRCLDDVDTNALPTKKYDGKHA